MAEQTKTETHSLTFNVSVTYRPTCSSYLFSQYSSCRRSSEPKSLVGNISFAPNPPSRRAGGDQEGTISGRTGRNRLEAWSSLVHATPSDLWQPWVLERTGRGHYMPATTSTWLAIAQKINGTNHSIVVWHDLDGALLHVQITPVFIRATGDVVVPSGAGELPPELCLCLPRSLQRHSLRTGLETCRCPGRRFGTIPVSPGGVSRNIETKCDLTWTGLSVEVQSRERQDRVTPLSFL